MDFCIECKENKKEPGEELCSFCLIKKVGLPWMSQMNVRHTMTAEIAYVEVNGKEFLVISGSNGMLFTKEQAIEAEERFNGEIDLQK